MVDKARGPGYRNLGFTLDRGYFSKENITYKDNNRFVAAKIFLGNKAEWVQSGDSLRSKLFIEDHP